VFEAVNKAGRGLGTKIAGGGNFSKDSLYAEIDAEQFIELRKRYNVISTEMEQTALLKLCAEYRKAGASVHGGLVSGVIGVLPDSFAKGKDVEERMRRVEEETLKLAAGALWHIARG
jgi:uridine phosphorylase